MSSITAYGVWFWAHGVNNLASCDRRVECGGLDTFFFTPMKVEAMTTRGICLVMAIGPAVYYGVMAITAAIVGVVSLVRKLRGKDDEWELIGHPESQVALSKRE